MDLIPVLVKLPETMATNLAELAAQQDISSGQILRKLLSDELRRKQNAKTPNRADEQLVARLQRLLASDMAAALGWEDLAQRLARAGYTLRPAGGGLTLHDKDDGRRLCKASEIGFAYSRLVRRFRAPMPGHPHRMVHITGLRQPDDDMDLIEHW